MQCESGKVITNCGCLNASDTDPNACARLCPNDDMDHPTYFYDHGCEGCVYLGAHNEDGNWDLCHRPAETINLVFGGPAQRCCEERSAIVSAEPISSTEVRICVTTRVVGTAMMSGRGVRLRWCTAWGAPRSR
jgi:hypothetical protein